MDGVPALAETLSTGSGSELPLPEDLLTCPITFHNYQTAAHNDGLNVPYDPPCHHTLSKKALTDIISQADPEKWRCPMCNATLPYNDIKDYNPNRFALGVLEAMEAAERNRQPPGEDEGPAKPEQNAEPPVGYGLLPEDLEIQGGWKGVCNKYDVEQLAGTLQRFQAQEDFIAKHRNGDVTSGMLSLNGRDTRVAVKLVLPTEAASNEELQASARLEAAILAHVTRHVPAAVLELKGFMAAGSFLIAQDVPDSSLVKHLEQVINEQGGLKASAWLELMMQLADCLKRLHNCGVIHCDVSPASIVRSPTGILKLTDFSSARLCAMPEGDSMLLRAPVATFPSRRFAYLAPEQLIQVAARKQQQAANREGRDAAAAAVLPGTVTDRTDVWAFAVVALHLWTGVAPTRGITPDCAATNLPDLLKDLFMGCLNGSPEQRLSAAEVYDNLCIVSDNKEEIPQFAPGTEAMVGLPGADVVRKPRRVPPQPASSSPGSRTSAGPIRVSHAGDEKARPTVQPGDTAAPGLTKSNGVKVDPLEEALRKLLEEQENEARLKEAQGGVVQKPGKIGAILGRRLKASK